MRLRKWFEENAVIIGVVFIILTSLVLIFDSAYGWSVEGFCEGEANNSISEYIECVDYFNNLSEVVYVTNNITTINNFTNDIFSGVDVSEFATKSYVKTFTYDEEDINEIILMLLEKEKSNILNDDLLSDVVTLKSLQNSYYSKEDVDEIIEETLKPMSDLEKQLMLERLRQNITVSSVGLKEADVKGLISDELKFFARDIQGLSSKSSGFNNSYLFIAGGVILLVLLNPNWRKQVFGMFKEENKVVHSYDPFQSKGVSVSGGSQVGGVSEQKSQDSYLHDEKSKKGF